MLCLLQARVGLLTAPSPDLTGNATISAWPWFQLNRATCVTGSLIVTDASTVQAASGSISYAPGTGRFGTGFPLRIGLTTQTEYLDYLQRVVYGNNTTSPRYLANCSTSPALAPSCSFFARNLSASSSYYVVLERGLHTWNTSLSSWYHCLDNSLRRSSILLSFEMSSTGKPSMHFASSTLSLLHLMS